MNHDHALDDHELIRRAQQNDVEALNCLYERHLPAVYRRIRYTVPETDVEDITQEVFLAVLISLESFSGEAQFSTWLRTLTNRKIADYYRKRSTRQAGRAIGLGEAERRQLPELRTPAPTRVADEQIVVQQALVAIPGRYQEIILLRFAEELPFKEIARLQGLTLEAAKSLFRRAIAALRNELSESHE